MTVILAFLVSGCATAPLPRQSGPDPREGRILTRADIARTGARSAWEAIRLGGTRLIIQQTREGSPERVTLRGVSSLLLSPQVLLIVDGAQMEGLQYLKDIRPPNIEYIQILSAHTATVRYGTAGGNGVIIVRTGVPPSRDTLPPLRVGRLTRR